MWLRCRVVAVFVLFLERKATVCDLKAKRNALVPLFDIALAGFVAGLMVIHSSTFPSLSHFECDHFSSNYLSSLCS